MAVLVVPHVVQVSAFGKVSGRPWASVWGVENVSSWWQSGAPVSDVVRDFANNWQDHIMGSLTNNVTLEGFAYISLNSADGSTGVLAPDSAKRTVGAGTATPCPPNTTLLIRKMVGSGRGKRSGRSYLPGVAEINVDPAGVIAAATVTAVKTAIDAFWAGMDNGPTMNDQERHLVVIHRPPEARLPGPQVVTGSSSRVTSLTCDSLVATQRRRLRS